MTVPTTAVPRDSDLIADSRTEPEAFAVLFDRYAGMLYRYVSRRMGPEIAEDLVGETFLVAFAGRSGYDLSYADARPWLFGIITNLVSRHRRTEAAFYRALQRSPIEDVAQSDDDRVANGVTARAARPLLARALAGLPARDRNVLLLVAWSDLSYEEVAQALGVPIGTVRSRLNRARRKVRAVLGDSNPMREEN
jgi:RNA polymerase sigma-70 factor (ECF subfamily)